MPVLEAELDTGRVTEIALVVVTPSEGIAKAGEEIIKLHGPDSDLWGDRDVDTSADDEIERIVAGRLAGAASRRSCCIDFRKNCYAPRRTSPQQTARNAKSGT